MTLSTDSHSDIISGLHHALRAPRRRQVISLIHNADEAITVRELAREITAIEQDIPFKNATGEPYRNVYNALSQTHLETLAEANIIIYESNRQTVAPGDSLTMAVLLQTIGEPIVEILTAGDLDIKKVAGDLLPTTTD